jgi:hypothetical protein
MHDLNSVFSVWLKTAPGVNTGEAHKGNELDSVCIDTTDIDSCIYKYIVNGGKNIAHNTSHRYKRAQSSNILNMYIFHDKYSFAVPS